MKKRKNVLIKDFYMELKKSWPRFISILIMVFLGVAFYSGVRASGPDMTLSGDLLYDNTSFMNVRIFGELGLTEADLNEVIKIEGVEYAEGGYTTDVIMNTKNDSYPVTIMSQTDVLDQMIITDGRLPKKTGECFIDSKLEEFQGCQIGDVVTLNTGTKDPLSDTIACDTYTVVGIGDSPYYISQERGTTTIGNGQLNGFVMIPKEDFVLDVYTQILVAVEDTRDLLCYSKEYEDKVEAVVDRIEEIADTRCEIRLAEVKKEAEEKIREGEQEIKDGEKELADAEKELKNARKELDAGKKEIQKNESLISSNEQKLIDGEKEIADGKKQISSAKKELDAGKKELETGKKELDQAKAEFDKAKKQLDDTKELLDASKQELDQAKNTLDQTKELIDFLDEVIENGKSEIKELENAISGLPPSLQEYAKKQLENAKAEYEKGLAQYKDLKKQYEEGLVQYEDGLKKYEDGKKQYEQGLAQYEEGYETYLAGLKEYEAGEEEINRNEALLSEEEKKLLNGEIEILKGKLELEKGKSEISKAKEKLLDGEKELLKGEKEFREKSIDAKKEIADAKRKIADARKEIAKLEVPEWYVLDRDTIQTYVEFDQDAERVANIGKVVPIIFFAVAALVCLTTMTRMIQEDRTQIGVLKALGYNKMQISMKYLLYALSSSVIGTALGALFGQKFLPFVIIKAYATMYRSIQTVLTPLHVDYTAVSVMIAVGCILYAAFSACRKTLREVPSNLMRPVAPKAGKKTLIERLSLFWKRLNFSQKAALRNLMRYKKRLMMTVIGIGGCMGLLLTGFGIEDSIKSIGTLQFERVVHYDTNIHLTKDLTESEMVDLEYGVMEDTRIKDYMLVKEATVDVATDAGEKSAAFLVPENPDRWDEYFALKERKSDTVYELTDEGVIVTEKLAKMLEIEKGDKIRLKEGNERAIEARVLGIVENYYYHYVHMTPALYEELTGKEPVYGNVYTINESNEDDLVEGMREEYMELDSVTGISFNSDTDLKLSDMLKAMDAIIVIIVVAAGLLAFVVLYNLNNINIGERTRELATLKVLGFYDREVSQYIFRENIILTFLGMIGGVVIGVLLHRFVILTVEVDLIMFGRDISLLSYLYSVIFTLIFSFIVNGAMHFKMKKIDMIESLKSVE